MTTYDPMASLAFKWGGAPCTYDPKTSMVATTLDHVDPALKAWIESIYGTGREEAELIARVEATVAAGEDTTAIEAELTEFYRAQNWRAQA
jgi:hypothetical protein